MTKQDQQAGDNSQQLQAARDINIFGVSAADVVEITRAEVSRVLDELTLSAKGKASARIEALANRVVTEFRDRPDLFEAFADPDFQYSLSDAGRAAASNDEEHTEQLLVDLLTNRAVEGNAPRVRLATSQAIKAADKLSRDALNGVTALWAVSYLSSTREDFVGEIESASEVAKALIALGLPSDKGWIPDIDVLNLGRLQYNFNRRSYNEIMKVRVASDLVPGMDPSESHELIASAVSAIPEADDQIASHPLKPGFLKLAGKDADDLLSKLPTEAASSPELQRLIGQNGYGQQDNTAVTALVANIAQSLTLSTLAAWWDDLPVVHFTAVGDVVGFVNTRRHIKFTGANTITEMLERRSR